MENKESLRSLIGQSNELVALLADAGGEITPQIETMLAVQDVKLPAKIDGYAAIMERLELEESYWKAKSDEFYKIAKGCANTRDRLKESLKFAMKELGTDELTGVDVRFKLSNSKPKMIIDIEKIDKAYTLQVTTIEVDKKRIEEDLKLGVPVLGAHLEPTQALKKFNNSKVAK